MIPEIPVIPVIAFPEFPENHSSNSGKSLDYRNTGNPENRTTEAGNGTPGAVRILLGRTASEHLTTMGAACFAVIGKASYPDDPARWVIHLVPSTIKDADAACKVATGKARAVKLKPASKP